MKKIKPIYIGYNNHDATCMYKCPICGKVTDGWTLWRNKDICECGQQFKYH